MKNTGKDKNNNNNNKQKTKQIEKHIKQLK